MPGFAVYVSAGAALALVAVAGVWVRRRRKR